MKNRFLLFSVLWIICGFIAGTGVNAYFRHEFSDLFQDKYEARSNLVFSMGWGILGGPFSLVVGVFLSGGYQNGFSLEYKPFPCLEKDYPDIWCAGNEPSRTN